VIEFTDYSQSCTPTLRQIVSTASARHHQSYALSRGTQVRSKLSKQSAFCSIRAQCVRTTTLIGHLGMRQGGQASATRGWLGLRASTAGVRCSVAGG
jgi:hypothetical protein